MEFSADVDVEYCGILVRTSFRKMFKMGVAKIEHFCGKALSLMSSCVRTMPKTLPDGGSVVS